MSPPERLATTDSKRHPARACHSRPPPILFVSGLCRPLALDGIAAARILRKPFGSTPCAWRSRTRCLGDAGPQAIEPFESVADAPHERRTSPMTPGFRNLLCFVSQTALG